MWDAQADSGRGSKQGNTRNAEPLCWCGFVDFRCNPEPPLFEPRRDAYVVADRSVEKTYCIITVEATGAVAEIHDRMPLVIDEEDWPLWLATRC